MAGTDLAELPTARRPAGREQQPVWDIIQEALSKAPGVIREVGGRDENDWFYVLVAALNLVINTRDREAAANPAGFPGSAYQQALAYADHYLQMRADAFNLGPDSNTVLRNAVLNYDLLKVRGLEFKTGPGPVSPATDLSVFWGMKGIDDGFEDRKHHKLTTHVGPAAYDIALIVGQATLLSAQVLFRLH